MLVLLYCITGIMGFLTRHGFLRDSFGMTVVLLEGEEPAGGAGQPPPAGSV